MVSWPTLNGKPIDLYKLYRKVVALGGWERVCEKERWTDVGVELDESIFGSCTMGAHALKIVYVRYLSAFERCVQALATTGFASLAPGQINVSRPFASTLLDAGNPNSSVLTLFLSSLTLNQVQQIVNGG